MRRLFITGCAIVIAMTSAMAQEAQTLKERLSDKASDAQRVDNCKVPLDRRGAVPRPDCPEKPQMAAPAAKAGTAAHQGQR